MAEHQWKVGDTFRCNGTCSGGCSRPPAIIVEIAGILGTYNARHYPDWGGRLHRYLSNYMEPYDWPDEVLASYTAYRLVKGG